MAPPCPPPISLSRAPSTPPKPERTRHPESLWPRSRTTRQAFASAASIASLLTSLGCFSYQPAVGPLVTACLGECGEAIATQASITNVGSTSGCPKAACNVQLKIIEESNLCPNRSVKVVVATASAQLWSASYTLIDDPSIAGAVKPGHVELLLGGTVAPSDVLTVIAKRVDSETGVVCKQEGRLQFEVTLLH